MKTVKELKKNVVKRMMCCWGENIAIFFLTVGGTAAIIIAWTLTADLLGAPGSAVRHSPHIDLTNGAVLAATAAAPLLIWILTAPFSYGVKWYRLQQIRGVSVHARSIFSCYGSLKRMGQVFRFSIALFVRQLYFIIPFTAAAAAGLLLLNGIKEKGGSIVYSAAAVIVSLLAGFLFCAAAALNYKYAPAPYLFTLEPDTPPKEIIKKSAELTKGRFFYLAEAVVSASVWLIPCILIFPAMFVVPYINMVRTAAVNEIIEDGDKDGVKREDALEEEYTGY